MNAFFSAGYGGIDSLSAVSQAITNDIADILVHESMGRCQHRQVILQ
ncbi:hypothetical protein [Kosakonia oryziphila]|nr:hypothetical protein [Kosakonia oryziphila]